MVIVDALDGDFGVGGDVLEGEVEGLGGAVVAGIDEVPGGDGEGAVGGFRDDEVLGVVGDALVAELVEEAELVVAGLVDAALGDEAEGADEGLVDGAAFFEDVVEGPEGHLGNVAVALADGVGEGWADVGGVAGVVGADDVPLGPEEREMRGGGGVDLGANFLDGAADAVVLRDVFGGAHEVLDGVVCVAVGGDEVYGDAVGGGVGEEGGDPGGGSGCGPAYAEARVDVLEVAGGVVVELEVGGLLRESHPRSRCWVHSRLRSTRWRLRRCRSGR